MFCLGLPSTLLNISHFIVGAMFSSFNSHTYLANSVQLQYFWCLKSLLWLLCFSLKVVSARPMYLFMSSLTALATVALYTSCDVKHSLFRGQLSFFQQLHPNDVVLEFTMFLLWEEITELILFMQLQLIFTVFMLKSCVEHGWLKNVSSVILEILYPHLSLHFLNRVG